MNKRNIAIETTYELKRIKRSILFLIFALTSIGGVLLYVYFPTTSSSVPQYVNVSPIAWSNQALSSAIPFKTAYYFNLLQLLFAIFFTLNDYKVHTFSTNEALLTRPQYNNEIIIGGLLGKYIALSTISILLFIGAAVINLLFYPHSFNGWYYVFYWFTLVLPTLMFVIGTIHAVHGITKNKGISLIILLIISFLLIMPGSEILHGLLDPCARKIPNMFSDISGHVNPGHYLLQRGFILAAGLSLFIAAFSRYPRIPNNPRAGRVSAIVVSIPLAITLITGSAYLSRYTSIEQERNSFRAAIEKTAHQKKVSITENSIKIKEITGGQINAICKMQVENKNEEKAAIILFLNPGLKVKQLKVNGNETTYTRDLPVIKVEKNLDKDERCEVYIEYEGKINDNICYLNIPETQFTGDENCHTDIYYHGQTHSLCENNYKLFTPECMWYPIADALNLTTGITPVHFCRYELEVEHSPERIAISQGNRVEREKGKTCFTFEHNMPGISLCIGHYAKKEVFIDSLKIAIYYNPKNEYLFDVYSNPKSAIDKFKSFKSMIEGMGGLKSQLYGNTSNPVQGYPYKWFTLVETPCNFHRYTNITQTKGEREQGGIMFLPESLHSIPQFEYRTAKNEEGIEYMNNMGMENDINILFSDNVQTIYDNNSCKVSPIIEGKNIHISHDFPLLTQVLIRSGKESELPFMLSHNKKYYPTQYLSKHSLKEAIEDKNLSSDILEQIISIKIDELKSIIVQHTGIEAWKNFLIEFIQKYLFEEVDSKVFFALFQEKFNINIESILTEWYNRNRLPLFVVKDGKEIEIQGENEEKITIIDFKILNKGEVVGSIEIEDQYYTINPGEAKRIRKRKEKEYATTISFIIAQNIPSSVVLSNTLKDNAYTDTITGVSDISLDEFPKDNKNDIIVDNEDPGFSVTTSKKKLIQLFKKKKKFDNSNQNGWHLNINESYYGFPIQSAYTKYASNSGQKVQWETTLPKAGKYEVFFYNQNKNVTIYKNKDKELHYLVFDGKEEHKVIAEVGKENCTEWISLGIFKFTEKARVSLIDKDKKQTNDGEFHLPQKLVADAVKWVKIE